MHHCEGVPSPSGGVQVCQGLVQEDKDKDGRQMGLGIFSWIRAASTAMLMLYLSMMKTQSQFSHDKSLIYCITIKATVLLK